MYVSLTVKQVYIMLNRFKKGAWRCTSPSTIKSIFTYILLFIDALWSSHTVYLLQVGNTAVIVVF